MGGKWESTAPRNWEFEVTSEWLGKWLESLDNTRLACVKSGDIFIMSVDGSMSRKVTRGYLPSWSPDASRIVYMTSSSASSINGEIFMINSDGSNARPLGVKGIYPSWSPIDQKIMFASEGDDQIENIYVVDESGNLFQLTDNQDKYIGYISPLWSPDGSKIAVETIDHEGYSLWIMNATGTNPKRIVSNHSSYFPFAWSPDGASFLLRDEKYDLVLMDLSGNTLSTFRVGDLFTIGGVEGIVYSFDGSRILFWTSTSIYLMNSNGTTIVKLPSNIYSCNGEISWSP